MCSFSENQDKREGKKLAEEEMPRNKKYLVLHSL